MSLSAADMTWLLAREGAEPGLWLLTLTGSDLPGGVLRLVRNTEDVTSNGNLFSAAWFDLVVPEDSDAQPQVTLTVPNVDRAVGRAMLAATGSLTATVQLVRPSAFNSIVYEAAFLKMKTVSIDPLTVEGTLSVATLDTEPYGAIRVVPAHFPWLNHV